MSEDEKNVSNKIVKNPTKNLDDLTQRSDKAMTLSI